MSSGDMEHSSNDDKPPLEQQLQKPLDISQQRAAVPPRPRRVGYAMSQAPRHRRTSGNADFAPSTAYHQQQQIAAAMAAAAAQQCYPATVPFFIQQNSPAGASPNGFDTQFITYPTTGHLEAPFLFYDGKGYSIIPASMIPSTSASFNHLGYFLTPAATANPATSYRQFIPADAAIAAEQPQRIPCVETSDKAVQVNMQAQIEAAPVAIVSGGDNEEEDYWSVGSHNDDLCKRVELCNLIENSNYQQKDEEASEKCSSESYDGSVVSDKKLDTWDATSAYSEVRNEEPVCDQTMFNSVVPRQEQQEEEEERTVQPQTDAQPVSNHRKSWASLFKPGGQSAASNGSQSDSAASGTLQPVHSLPAENSSPQWCPPKTTSSAGGRYSPRYRIVPNDFIQIGGFFRNFECRQSAPALTPRGFYNSGNYCYVNSVLQALLACPMFFNFIGSLPHIRDAGKLPTSPSEEVKENNAEESNNKSDNAKLLFAPTFISRVKQIFDSFPPMQRTSQSARGAPPYRRNQPDLKVGEPLHIDDFHHLAQSLWFNKALGQQEDAHEFLCHILQEIHNECLLCMKLASSSPSKETKETDEANGENEEDDGDSEWQEYYGKRVHIHREIPVDATPISEIFAGCFRTSLERGGSTTSSNMEPFHSLSLDGDSPTIIQALKALNSRVPVAGLANPITKKPTKAFQSMMIEKLPPCLILHLKCFVWSKTNGGVKKLFPKMAVPVDLTIPQEIMSRTSTSSRYYKLFAVIHHRGKSVNNGHYICDVFHPGLPGWIRCDDQRVSVVHSREVLSNVASNGSSEDRSSNDLSPFILLYRQQ